MVTRADNPENVINNQYIVCPPYPLLLYMEWFRQLIKAIGISVNISVWLPETDLGRTC